MGYGGGVALENDFKVSLSEATIVVETFLVISRDGAEISLPGGADLTVPKEGVEIHVSVHPHNFPITDSLEIEFQVEFEGPFVAAETAQV